MKKILALALTLLTVVSFSACSLINYFTKETLSEEVAAPAGEELSKLYESKITIDSVEYDYSKVTIADFLKDGWTIAAHDEKDLNTFYGEVNLIKGDKSFFVQNAYLDPAQEEDDTLPISALIERIENYADDYKPVLSLPGGITLMNDYPEISTAYGTPDEYSGSPTSANITYGLNNGTYIYFQNNETLDETTQFTNTFRSLSIQSALPYTDYHVATEEIDDLPVNIGDQSPEIEVSVADENISEKSPDTTLETSTEEGAESGTGLDMTSPNIDDAPVNLNDESSTSTDAVIINDNPVEGA